MKNDPITLEGVLRALLQIFLSAIIGIVLLYGTYYVWIKLRHKVSGKFESIKDRMHYNVVLETLNFSVINDDIKDIVKMIKIQSWEEPDNKNLVKKRFIEEVTDLIYELRYLESYQTTAQKYYAFLTEGISGSVDNVSTVYLKTLIELRIELKKKKYMSDEAEYKKRENQLILLIEEEINKNFEKVKEMKHSKNQSALDKADYIIKNGGIK